MNEQNQNPQPPEEKPFRDLIIGRDGNFTVFGRTFSQIVPRDDEDEKEDE